MLHDVKYSQRTSVNKSPLIDTESIHYNPTGPGDYEIPSAFGNLPKPRKQMRNRHRSTMNSLKAKDNKVLVKENPKFTIGQRIENSRVFANNMNNFLGVDTPGVGHYSPIKGGLEDSTKMQRIKKKYTMYSV